MRNTTITINQTALAHNLSTIKHTLNPDRPAKVLAMVKANAYGHGISHTLSGLGEADAFGVACMSEALEVQEVCQTLDMDKPIVLIEGVFGFDEWQLAREHGFGCVIHNTAQLNFAIKHPAKPDSFTRTVWLKYNTGMNRLGFDKDGVICAAKALHQAGYKLILTSHFACADEPNHPITAKQIARFDEILHILRTDIDTDIQASLCNSAGIFSQPDCHHDWVRAGIALYGGKAVADRTAYELGLRPAMTFGASIFATHQLRTGESVSYGGLWTADKPAQIGVLSVGYGDGYPRVVNGAKVLIIKENQPYFVPIIGRVAMDTMMIDISDLSLNVGDEVLLWGDGLPAHQVASWANTIDYELFCKTTNRPTRRTVV
ncbi:alanine racemase [Moraxella nasibovis]|uniref:alanine racemase n=1 Tax=Moraxella nasibovis TaxID=2904120 RepID=UPI00240F557E|nr:alanine racemase [Moraxella nasibovis]WFF39505.1 alanine racemase [Moraxella nasibovis]